MDQMHSDLIDMLSDAPAPMARLYRHWQSLRTTADIPSRAVLDPLDISYCLGNLLLTEVETDPLRFRYRLVGTNLVDLYGEEATGRYVHQMFSRNVRREAIAAYSGVVAERRPAYAARRFRILFRELGYHRLMLPFADGEDRVGQVLVAIYPLSPDLRKAGQWRPLVEDLASWEEVAAESAA